MSARDLLFGLILIAWAGLFCQRCLQAAPPIMPVYNNDNSQHWELERKQPKGKK